MFYTPSKRGTSIWVTTFLKDTFRVGEYNWAHTEKMAEEYGLRKRNDSLNTTWPSLSLNIDIQTSHSKSKDTNDGKGKVRDRHGNSGKQERDDDGSKKLKRFTRGSVRGKQIGTTLWNVLLSELNIEPGLEKENIENRDQSGNTNTDIDRWSDNLELLLNYIRLPMHLERFMTFGLLYSAVIFLKWLVIIPLRCFIHTVLNIVRFVQRRGSFSSPFVKHHLIYKNDLLSVTGIMTTLFLLRNLDTSRIYHNIRAGTAVKLYFMTQVLDIADRLLSASGQDILRVTYQFNSITVGNRLSLVKVSQFLALYVLSILYLWFHSYALVYQVMALNVAINSYSNALLTLILSNQFSELKSAVFKRTEREGLFQATCADLNERFLILIMLAIISSRNFLQILINTTSINDFFDSLKPDSWSTQLTQWESFDNWLGLLMGPSILVIGSEILVDWVKYAYIIRFNRIRPKVYDKFTKILANDFVNGFTSDNFSRINHQPNEHPSLLTKRTGFPISTVSIIFCKLTLFPYLQYLISVVYERNNNAHIASCLIISTVLIALVSVLISLRLLLSLIILSWSRVLLQRQLPKQTDYVSGDPNVNLSHVADVREHLYDDTEALPPSLEDLRLQKLHKNRDDKLTGVVRFEMADKRIW